MVLEQAYRVQSQCWGLKDTQNDHKINDCIETQNNLLEMQNKYTWAVLCLFQSGCLLLYMQESFYMSVSRGPLSHIFSLSIGYLELQITAI